MKLSVILPTYNESASIVLLINEIIRVVKDKDFDYEIIIVDDNSPDKTYDVVKTTFAEQPCVRPLLRTSERGLATAIWHGIQNSTGDKVLVMDTDFNHPPKLIPLLVKITDYFDIAIGSRYVIGGGMETSRLRYLGSKIFNRFIQFVLSVQTRDNLSGYFAFNKKIIQEVNSESIFYGYGDYFIRFLYLLQRLGKPIIEVPVVYQDREGGLSKTSFSKEILRYTKTVLKIRFGIWKK